MDIDNILIKKSPSIQGETLTPDVMSLIQVWAAMIDNENKAIVIVDIDTIYFMVFEGNNHEALIKCNLSERKSDGEWYMNTDEEYVWKRVTNILTILGVTEEYDIKGEWGF